MKPLMSIPPAQAEALFDAYPSVFPAYASPEETWLDEDTPDDFVLFTLDKDRLIAPQLRGQQAA